MEKVEKILFALGIGASLMWGKVIVKTKTKEVACVLKKIYLQCQNDAKEKRIIRNKKKCEKMSEKLALLTYLSIVKKTKKEEAKNVAVIIGSTCYSGCMKQKDAFKFLNEKCKK
jgi:uncharacterized protein YwlG (UPF0340 family)